MTGNIKSSKLTSSLLVSFSVYLLTFLFFYIAKERTLPINVEGREYLLFYLLSWALGALFARRFISRRRESLISAFYPLVISFILMLGFFSGLSILFDFNPSGIKFLFLFSAFHGLLLDILLIVKKNGFTLSLFRLYESISFNRLFFEMLLLLVIFAGFWYIKKDNTILSHSHFPLLLLLMFVNWLISGIASGLFQSINYKRLYWENIWRYVKAYILLFMLLTFISFVVEIQQPEIFFVYKILILYSFMSLLTTTAVFITRRPGKTDAVEPILFKADELDYDVVDSGVEDQKQPDDTRASQFSFPAEEQVKVDTDEVHTPLREKMRNVYMAKFPLVFEFLDKAIDLNSIDINKAVMIRSRDLYNVEVLPEHYLQLFCNFHEINDLRQLNQYFIEVSHRLLPSGLFVGKVEPIKLRYERFIETYPFYFANLFYFFDFVWTRVIPKLPVLQYVYFTLTKGKNRAISLSESLGRLYFCGFEVVAIEEIGSFVYFIARKVGEVKTQEHPSYGPIFKMKRIGKGGKVIYVYKMRTMHPYSEYLQKFIYDRNKLQEGGKIKDDFRITSWGRVFRKLWIDELPMIYNMLKGELKIVGVRPLSQHYLSLYSTELKEMRKKHKPGLIPPFYVDMPKTLEEIQQSEMNYLKQCDISPFKTDVKYFFKSLYNIFIKRARSA